MKKAIDVHGHFGDPACFPQKGLEKIFLQISLDELKQAYDAQNIEAACLSPMEGIFSSSEETLLQANHSMAELTQKNLWLYQWAIINPLFPASFRQAEELLKSKKCVGIKIHPDAHGYAIADHGDEIFAFCNQHRTVLETHSGDALSLPEQIVSLADRYPRMNVIVSHLGCGFDGCLEHQIQAIRQSKNGNIYTDVSSARSILPHLLEWGVGQVGADKILFGTDTPLHHIAMMKQRVEFADLPELAIEKILFQNAYNLFSGVFEL